MIETLAINEREKNLLQVATLKEALEYLKGNPKHTYEDFSKLLNRQKKQEFPDKPKKLLGDISKLVEDNTLKRILEAETKEKIKLTYLFMFSMGLRVSEAVRINKKDIISGRLKINNIKCKRKDKARIPKQLMNLTEIYLEKYSEEIENANGYLIYSENPTIERDHISENWIRGHFRETTLKLGINEIYDWSTEPKNHIIRKTGKVVKRKSRPLYLFSTHSGRHTFCMKFYSVCNFDLEKLRIAMRIRDFTTLKNYLKGNIEEVNELQYNMNIIET
ncbi:MAG: site-specific integrase [Nanoarchaeota archaeon]